MESPKSALSLKPHCFLKKIANPERFQVSILAKIPEYIEMIEERRVTEASVQIYLRASSGSSTAQLEDVIELPNIPTTSDKCVIEIFEKTNGDPQDNLLGKATVHFDDAESDNQGGS
ncbi:MAG: hypothetical protein AAF206_05235 [Bacteroidota bacterium]